MGISSPRLCCVALLSLLVANSALAADRKPIKLGATFALSGSLAYMGERERDGMLFALEEINAQGGVAGRQLQLIVEDNRGEPKTAVSTVQKLLAADQIDLLFSAFTHITQAVKNLARQHGKVLLYQSTFAAIAQENPLFFQSYYDATEVGERIIGALEKRRAQRVALLTEQHDASLACLKRAREVASAKGLIVVASEIYSAGESDFRPLLLRFKTAQADGIGVCGFRDAALIMRQLQELGMLSLPTAHFAGHNPPVADTPEIRKLFEDNQAVDVWYGVAEETENQLQRQFVDRFFQRFGHQPASDAAFSYDMVMLLAKALPTCVSESAVDTACLAQRLTEVRIDGVAGPLSLGPERVAPRRTFLVEVKNGHWVLVDKAEASAN